MKFSSSSLLSSKENLPNLKYYVYAIYLNGRNIPAYIGKGQGGRWRHYFYYPEKVSNRILRKKLVDLKENQEDYYVEFLFETDDEQECLDVESFFITYFGRVFNSSGFLYNFDLENHTVVKERPGKRKPIYIDGFIFDSIGRAKSVTGIKSETIKKYREIGRACLLDEPEEIEKVQVRQRKLKYHWFYQRHKKLFKKARKIMLISEGRQGKDNWMYGKATPISKRIEVDGVTYRSLSKAAEAYGFGKGYSFKRMLLKGNHNHTWKILD